MTDTRHALAAMTTHALLVNAGALAKVVGDLVSLVGESTDAELTTAADRTHPQSADVREALAKLDEALRALGCLQKRAMLPETTELERAEIGPEMVDAAIGAEAFAVSALTALLPLLAKPDGLRRTRDAVDGALATLTEFGTVYYTVLNAAAELQDNDPPLVVH